MVVVGRVRPVLGSAQGSPVGVCVREHGRLEVATVPRGRGRGIAGSPFSGCPSPTAPLQRMEYPFSFALGPESSQEEVFSSVRPAVESALSAGQNCCVFAYGQTGSGKTYTMLGGGSFKARGLMQRVLGLVFSHVDKSRAAGGSLGVSMSMCEVYGEAAYDLLGHLPESAAEVAASADPVGVGSRLTAISVESGRAVGPLEVWPKVVLFEGEGGTLNCRGLRTWQVGTEAAALGLLLAGHLARTTSSTPLNQSSSRSHALLSITVAAPQGGSGAEGCAGASRIYLVDLAGSERVHKGSSVEGAIGGGVSGSGVLWQRESMQINFSLHCLELVMLALAEKQASARSAAAAAAAATAAVAAASSLFGGLESTGSGGGVGGGSNEASAAAVGECASPPPAGAARAPPPRNVNTGSLGGVEGGNRPHLRSAPPPPSRRISLSSIVVGSVAGSLGGGTGSAAQSVFTGASLGDSGQFWQGRRSTGRSRSASRRAPSGALFSSSSPSHVHIPYRNSVLTSILRDALGSNCRPILVACMAPELEHGEETSSTCRFAARCGRMNAVNCSESPSQGATDGTLGPSEADALRARVEELSALVSAKEALARSLGRRVAELEASAAQPRPAAAEAGSPLPSDPSAAGAGAAAEGLQEGEAAEVEAAVLEFLQRPPLSAAGSSTGGASGSQGGEQRRALIIEVLVPDSAALEGQVGGAILALSYWKPAQRNYAVVLLREAVAAAVAVAARTAGDVARKTM
jgi:hypothetical protein